MARITIGRKLNYLSDSVTVAQGPANGQPWPIRDETQLVPEIYDSIELTYYAGTDNIYTVTYKMGGTGGITVALLTLTYDSEDRITSVVRT